MIRWLNEADAVIKEKSTGTLHFYFFGYDPTGVAACYNIRPSDPWESTVDYVPEEDLRNEARELSDSGQYKIVKGHENIWENPGGEL